VSKHLTLSVKSIEINFYLVQGIYDDDYKSMIYQSRHVLAPGRMPLPTEQL